MSEVLVQIELLVEALMKKKVLMERILSDTKEQGKYLSNKDLDLRSFKNIMANKQVRIESLLRIDGGFESLYQRVKLPLTSQPDIYREPIGRMQDLIRETTNLGIEIQVQEERNKVQLEIKSRGVKGEAKVLRTHKSAMNSYNNNYSKQKKMDGPHFFDSKK